MKKYFSIFTGEVYNLDTKYTSFLDCGQLEVSNEPKKACAHCYGRGNTGKNIVSGHYNICKCVLKDASTELLKSLSEHQVEDVVLHTRKSDKSTQPVEIDI